MKSHPSKKDQKDKKQSKQAVGNPTPGKWNEMNRKQRREMMRKMQSEDLSLEVVHPQAAGIDIGNASHYVAVPPSNLHASLKNCAANFRLWLKSAGVSKFIAICNSTAVPNTLRL